jgi:4a-hydroxytetrahydrobiopterin dehydratase
MAKLADTEIANLAAQLPPWRVEQGKLHREFKFPDFKHAFAFMAAVATMAEAMNHHPEWSNVYNRVTVDLTTHDAGGISQKDFDLAKGMEAIASRLL